MVRRGSGVRVPFRALALSFAACSASACWAHRAPHVTISDASTLKLRPQGQRRRRPRRRADEDLREGLEAPQAEAAREGEGRGHGRLHAERSGEETQEKSRLALAAIAASGLAFLVKTNGGAVVMCAIVFAGRVAGVSGLGLLALSLGLVVILGVARVTRSPPPRANERARALLGRVPGRLGARNHAATPRAVAALGLADLRQGRGDHRRLGGLRVRG